MFKRKNNQMQKTVEEDDLSLEFTIKPTLSTYGTVYLAEMKSLDSQRVAVKEVHDAIDLLEEQKILERLKDQPHPNIVKYHGAVLHKQWLVFEYLEETLAYYLFKDKTTPHNPRPYEAPVRKQIAENITAGAHFLHRNNVIHCDLNATNIMLDSRMVAKIIDLGLSKIIPKIKTALVTPKTIGTANWHAPEQKNVLAGDLILSTAVDIWAIGWLLIFLLHIEKCIYFHLFDNEETELQMRTRGEIPTLPDYTHEGTRAMIIRCLNTDPAKRPPADELHQSLMKLPALCKLR